MVSSTQENFFGCTFPSGVCMPLAAASGRAIALSVGLGSEAMATEETTRPNVRLIGVQVLQSRSRSAYLSASRLLAHDVLFFNPSLKLEIVFNRFRPWRLACMHPQGRHLRSERDMLTGSDTSRAWTTVSAHLQVAVRRVHCGITGNVCRLMTRNGCLILTHNPP